MRDIFKLIALIAMCSAYPAQAAVGCQGSVNNLILAPEGDLFVDFGYNRLKICTLDATTTVDRGAANGGTALITAGRCTALYSAFLTAESSGRQIIAYVNRSDCNFVDAALPNPYPYSFYFPR